MYKRLFKNSVTFLKITFGLYGITEFDSIPLVCKVKEIVSINQVVKSNVKRCDEEFNDQHVVQQGSKGFLSSTVCINLYCVIVCHSHLL